MWYEISSTVFQALFIALIPYWGSSLWFFNSDVIEDLNPKLDSLTDVIEDLNPKLDSFHAG